MNKEILELLTTMNKLLALNVVKDMNGNEKILTLYKAGLKKKEIAELLNMKAKAVEMAIYRGRKRQKNK